MNASGLMILLFLSFTTTPMPQRPQLEQKVKELFLAHHGTPDLKDRLRQLGDDKEIAALLMELATRYKYASQGTLELAILDGVVRAFGEIRLNSANELLSSLLVDQKVHQNVRAGAARSLGQIDPDANKLTLLKALNSSSDYYLLRIYAAEGLAKTRDAEALKALEQYGHEEKDSYVRQQFEKAAQAMRENGVKPN